MSDEEREGQKKGFKVTDRRRFAGGAGASEPSQEEEPASGDSPQEASGVGQELPGSAGQPGAAGQQEGPAPREITFSTFIMGISTQTLMNLGEIANPADGQKRQDLGAAKELIDLLGILRDKTAGNLDSGEQELLDGMLYDLRLRYVEVARKR